MSKRKTQVGYTEFRMQDLADAMYGERSEPMMRRLAREQNLSSASTDSKLPLKDINTAMIWNTKDK